ncbi:MAG TPA: 16S rRNA (cytosine(1402)-N(4))-methyltransferase RsmH [Acidimicrobiales bacterium]|nr:16S rRNA (cytosine(1402)-N(4))-methyltransferase RsmH [Acidimicrobiales bacterium]
MRCLPAGTVEEPHSARFRRARSGRNPDGNRSAGGQRMSQAPFLHRPVMVDEVVDLLGPVPAGVVVDATVGGGGHARALLEAHPHLRVVGLDRDDDALAAAAARLGEYANRVVLRHARFDRLGEVLDGLAIEGITGALFDLGVSSPQLDIADRGFSYREDAPLDMRMDRTERRTAADVVNSYDADELAHLFVDSGETRFARRIARAIIAARPITTTGRLAEVVASAVPAAARRRGHPAKRVFQALRIEVNAELDVLPVALDEAISRLVPGGRLVVLSYHSGEDRLVKRRFLDASTGGCVCPPGLPCVCGAVPRVRLLTRGSRKPGAAELAVNPRAESARLRAVEKLDVRPAPTSDSDAAEGI